MKVPRLIDTNFPDAAEPPVRSIAWSVKVAGMVVAVEGDPCRANGVVAARWRSEDLAHFARRARAATWVLVLAWVVVGFLAGYATAAAVAMLSR